MKKPIWASPFQKSVLDRFVPSYLSKNPNFVDPEKNPLEYYKAMIILRNLFKSKSNHISRVICKAHLRYTKLILTLLKKRCDTEQNFMIFWATLNHYSTVIGCQSFIISQKKSHAKVGQFLHKYMDMLLICFKNKLIDMSSSLSLYTHGPVQ